MKIAPILLLGVAVSIVLPCQALASRGQLADDYQSLYEKVDKRNVGPYKGGVAGRNIVDDGVLTKKGTRLATKQELQESMTVMRRMLNPAPIVAYEPTTEYEPTDTYYGSPDVSGASGCPSSMAAESGSEGYNAVSPDGIYIGCYQINEELHYGSGGVCEGLGTDPAGQDACAAAICEESGSGAWSNSAGTSPC